MTITVTSGRGVNNYSDRQREIIELAKELWRYPECGMKPEVCLEASEHFYQVVDKWLEEKNIVIKEVEGL